jgi:hypothetical protein
LMDERRNWIRKTQPLDHCFTGAEKRAEATGGTLLISARQPPQLRDRGRNGYETDNRRPQ